MAAENPFRVKLEAFKADLTPEMRWSIEMVLAAGQTVSFRSPGLVEGRNGILSVKTAGDIYRIKKSLGKGHLKAVK